MAAAVSTRKYSARLCNARYFIWKSVDDLRFGIACAARVTVVDDSLSRSWLDHVLCSKRFSNLFSDFHAIHSPSIHSDHFPLFFNIDITCTIIPHIQSHSVHRKPHILWSKASLADTDRYCHMVSSTIPELPPEVFTCVVPNCTEHIDTLDSYAKKFVFSLLDCACKCIPHSKTSSRTLVGWNDTSCNRLKQTANFWHKIWEDAGDPSSGVLFQIKRHTKTRYKYEVRHLKRRQNVLLLLPCLLIRKRMLFALKFVK